ncbi:MAG: DUF692 domain-containing protein [Candidatus Margulisbacteria bacterium]|nr:DUF692 domain-containing protein [Candidatus Margulisiibacteriota bacterium]
MTIKFSSLPYLGFGLGLRTIHFEDFIATSPEVDWLEIISENFLLESARPLYYLDQIMERYKVVPHGVSLSIGSSDSLNMDYLKRLKNLVKKLDTPWFSDHLCWGSSGGTNLHNLMPLPYTSEVAKYVAERVRIVQDFVEKPFILENVSSYLEFETSTMTEWDFLTEIVETADCGILLDVNNVFVSSQNHHFDPMEYMRNVPKDRVVQYHIAGHDDKGKYILDTHDHEIQQDVWDLYRKTIPLFDQVSLMLERDDHIPPLPDLLSELAFAKSIYDDVMKPHGI